MINEILKKYWGFDEFRPFQSEIIHAVLSGHDTLAVLPTGGGKSVCFQVPAIKMEGICLVISPLIALMKDQVESLKLKGIPALTLYSGLNFIEVKKVLQNAVFGNYKFLYVSPERLESSVFLEYLPDLPINLIAVDEAHCVSQWGYDFRPPYLRISAIRNYFPKVPILALTASATKEVQADILDKLDFNIESKTFRQSFLRPNLSYSIFNTPFKENKLIEIFKKINGSGIIYCKSRRKTKEIADLLNMHGISCGFYHAGLSSELRSVTQKDWMTNKFRIICCTNAFGMGIDKGNVKAVVHYDVPESLEHYYQEAGRAGRDGKKAYAVLLFNAKEVQSLQGEINIRFPGEKTIISIYKALVNYLQLPSDSGEGLNFNFDMNDFCKKFKLNSYTVVYSLKILQQEDIISYEQEVFQPSRVVFTTTKEQLSTFENAFPEFEPLIKSLLRSYNAIFDYPSNINEKHLSVFTHEVEKEVKAKLVQLDIHGIINYQPQTTQPQIQFLKNRMRSEDVKLNEKEILIRKKSFGDRIEGIINYIQDIVTCRSTIIGNYFADNNLNDCGICDNCINRQTSFQLDDPKTILSFLQDNQTKDVTIDFLLKNLHYKKEQIWKMLDFLIAEQCIYIDTSGTIIVKKKGPR